MYSENFSHNRGDVELGINVRGLTKYTVLLKTELLLELLGLIFSLWNACNLI